MKLWHETKREIDTALARNLEERKAILELARTVASLKAHELELAMDDNARYASNAAAHYEHLIREVKAEIHRAGT